MNVFGNKIQVKVFLDTRSTSCVYYSDCFRHLCITNVEYTVYHKNYWFVFFSKFLGVEVLLFWGLESLFILLRDCKPSTRVENESNIFEYICGRILLEFITTPFIRPEFDNFWKNWSYSNRVLFLTFVFYSIRSVPYESQIVYIYWTYIFLWIWLNYIYWCSIF